MRKRYFITALAVCLALVTAQAQEAVVKRTTTRKAAKMAPSERFVRVAKARGGEGDGRAEGCDPADYARLGVQV